MSLLALLLAFVIGAPAPLQALPHAGSAVALTFNDGPDGRFTPAILHLLARQHESATFFPQARVIAGDPAWLLEIARAGSEIGNHGLSHEAVEPRQGANVEAAQRLLTASGAPVALYRPPAGRLRIGTLRAARARHLLVVLWNRGSGDPGHLSSQAARDLARAVRAGDIVSLADDENGYRTLQMLLPVMHRRGLHAVSVSQLRGLTR